MVANRLEKHITSDEQRQIQNKSEVFVELFEFDRRRLYAYIFAYVMDHAAADDIFQETSMTLWHEFDKFELGTNFSKWANGIAFNRIRVYRRTNNKFTLGLSDELILSMKSTIDASSETTQLNRWNHLEQCRLLLPLTDQQLYHQFYVDNIKAQTIADQTKRSIFAIRKSIHKLRKKLFDCVDKKSMESLSE